MSKIKDLIEFLRLDRRHDEAEAQSEGVDESKVFAQTIDTNENLVIERVDFENINLFPRLVNVLDHFNATHFYILQETSKKVFYIKLSNNIIDHDYLNLETNKSETVADETLLQKIEIDYGTNHYFYDKNRREVIFSLDNLKGVTVFPDSIFFNPEQMDLDSDTYTYNYSKPISVFSQFINGIISIIKSFVSLLFLENNKNKDVVLEVKHKGIIYIIPTLYFDGNAYYAYYYYTNSNKKLSFQLVEEDIALKLKFNGKEPFLSFLNATIFTQQNFDYLDANANERRIAFVEKFKEIIIEPLERSIKSESPGVYYDALVTLYYLTDSVALTLSNECLWKLFEEGVKRNSLTNKLSLEEENIFVKLLEVIANEEIKKEVFLNRLLRKKDEKTTYLEFLYDRIHGDNGVKFTQIINSAWKQSRFVLPDEKQNTEFATTTGPLFLPYSSEKLFGFYLSNASIFFEDNLLKVDFDTGKKTYKTVKMKEDGAMADQVIEEKVIAHYTYHPFYPVFIKDIEKQETELKLDAIVPAFLLKANEDKAFWHNAIKSGEYALDALAIASGFGALAEFRYLKTVAQFAEAAEEVNAASKVAKAANILRYVKGASGVMQITSGSVNIMLKISGQDETEFGQRLSKVLFFLELITLAAELTVPMKNGLKNAAKEAIESSNPKIRKANRELFNELYKITGLDEIGRKILKVGNIEDIGRQGNKVLFKLLDDAGNEVGTLIRTSGNKGRKLIYELKIAGKTYPIESSTELLNTARSYSLPISPGENILSADFNIPTNITKEYSGLGSIMLDDSLAFCLNNPKFGKVDGVYGVWIQDSGLYNEYGGMSLNLKKFWESVSVDNLTYEEAAFETFTGKWARENGFEKAVIRDRIDDVTLELVIIKFIKK